MTPRVLLYVQHLLGIGHLRRAAAIARGLASGGFEVAFVSGGEAVPALDIGAARLVQLAAIRSARKQLAVAVHRAHRRVHPGRVVPPCPRALEEQGPGR